MENTSHSSRKLHFPFFLFWYVLCFQKMLLQTHSIHFNANEVMGFNQQCVLGSGKSCSGLLLPTGLPNHRESLLSLLVFTWHMC